MKNANSALLAGTEFYLCADFFPHQTIPVICLHCIQQQHCGKVTIQQAIFVTNYPQSGATLCRYSFSPHAPAICTPSQVKIMKEDKCTTKYLE